MSGPDTFGSGDAQILDRGYRRYDGVRTGQRGAIRSVVVHSVQRALGARRTIWAKVLPAATILIAYVPAIVFVGIVALIPADQIRDVVLPTYADYYTFIIAAIMVFVALVAPEILCTDRRSGMLGVYLASPLDRKTYLLAKGIAVAFVVSLVCLGPPLLMLIANILQSQGPDGADDIALTAARVVGTGLVVTALYTGVTMGIASLTDRKAVATAATILLFLVALAITGSITSTGGSLGVRTWSVTLLTVELATRIHGEGGGTMPSVPSATIWLAWAAWTFGGFGLAWYQLRRLPVTR
ncbi:ABC transporter permease [Aquihabitans sp. G128]|uniref:ABC transporter permease n=1 Tax=Aquihabitans sp. G128 TaxID=2849779 RepID=UPI001C22B5B0|nr:ABC transporter permease [Aquihabitans sp. G128]QXC63095.1 ABC transporter permease [Aquihabitans sp. G128]